MKNMIIAASALLIVTTLFAAAKTVDSRKVSHKPVDPEKMQALRMKWYGGDLIDRRDARGAFYVVNAQKAVDAELLASACAGATRDLRIDPKIEEGIFDIAAPALKGEATLFVVDDPRYPMSLVAIEARWALVNVARLKSDKPAFFAARVRKEVYRTVGQLFGAFSNQYESNIFSGVFSVEDLDQIVAPVMPLEYRMRYMKYIPQMGIVPYKVVHYNKAVEEGWAPAPTNEFQKAIWDKIHAMPTAPLAIKPETRKVVK